MDFQKDYTKEFDACKEYNEKLISIKQKVKLFFVNPAGEHFSPNFIKAEKTRSRQIRIPEISL